MLPVRTPESNFTYLGPRPEILDLPCERVHYEDGDRVVYSVWEPTPEEREAVANGANVKVGIFNQEPIPPISVGLRHPTPDELAAAVRVI